MSIDLGAIFAITQDVVEQLVETSGTTVRISRTPKGRADGESDPETLAVTSAAEEQVMASTPAVVAPLSTRAPNGSDGPDGTATEVKLGDMVVILLVDVEEVVAQDTVEVLTCRDPRLVGRLMDVVTILDSSAGAARILHARPRSLGTPDV